MKSSLAKHEAFHEQVKSGKSLTNAIRVYNALCTSPKTIHAMRNELSMAHQSLTASLVVLEDMGWAYKDSTVRIDNRSYTVYKAETDPDKALTRAVAMEKYKFNEWVRRGIANGWLSTGLTILPIEDLED